MSISYYVTITTNIVPNKVYYLKHNSPISSNITSVDEEFIIKQYKAEMVRGKIKKILILDGNHPNVNPKTRQYCLPSVLKGIEYSQESLKKIEKSLKVFNLLNCYMVPYGYFQDDKGHFKRFEVDYGF